MSHRNNVYKYIDILLPPMADYDKNRLLLPPAGQVDNLPNAAIQLNTLKYHVLHLSSLKRRFSEVKCGLIKGVSLEQQPCQLLTSNHKLFIH